MTDFLERELDTAQETGNQFYLLMLDLDHFKRINDVYGHGFGDQVLLACAQAVQGILRKGDIIARYGGEEFIVILIPQSSIKVSVLAERIRQAVESLQFQYEVTVTVSIGVTKCLPGDTVDDLINRADHCLYQAKQAGRNRVVLGNMVEAV
jgi:diguanylate cyclase (GGDEF)-like protein